MTTIRTRLEALEAVSRPTSSVMLDLESMSDDDLAFIESLGERCKPDYRQLSVEELRRLSDLAEQYARVAA